MNVKLKTTNDMVRFIMTAGVDYVVSSMPLDEAQKILDGAKEIKPSSKFDTFDVSVDKTYYFQTEKKKRNID